MIVFEIKLHDLSGRLPESMSSSDLEEIYMLRYIKIAIVSIAVAFCWSAIFDLDAKADDLTSHLTGISLGPGKLDLGGSLRFRYEYFDNYNVKKYGTGQRDDVLLTRVRINVGYTLPQKLKVFVQLQDARFFLSSLDKDDFGPSCPYLNELDLRQAFIQWREIGRSPLGFKIGRQTISYGDYRIFGPGDWGNVGRYTWDAGKILIPDRAGGCGCFYRTANILSERRI